MFDVARYYIVVRVGRTTICWVWSAITAAGVLSTVGARPEARQATAGSDQRREQILRSWRTALPRPAPLLRAERAWTRTLPTAPAASGVMDDQHVYIPLRGESFVALGRETGATEWARPISSPTTPVIGGGLVFVASDGALRALEAVDGRERWSADVGGRVMAPLTWDNGWLIAIAEPGDVVAFRAADGHQMWKRPVGATSNHPAVSGGDGALYLSLTDSRIVALALETGEPLWERQLRGTISAPAVARDRVFVGSTDNFLYAFDGRGTFEWKWRNGGDVLGVAADGDLVYVVSLDNIIRAVNRGNGNQRWTKPTGTRPTFPPSAFGGIVVLPGTVPAITTFVGATGNTQGTQTADGPLVGAPLIDTVLKPFRVALVTITREGVVEALRPTSMMFREAALTPITTLPGRALVRERLP